MENNVGEIQKILEDHEKRIKTLEFSLATKKSQTIMISNKKESNEFSGATGGVRYLISEGFFKEKRDLPSVRAELTKKGYYYSRQTIHEALKMLSKTSGPLVSLKEGKRKTFYVERK